LAADCFDAEAISVLSASFQMLLLVATGQVILRGDMCNASIETYVLQDIKNPVYCY